MSSECAEADERESRTIEVADIRRLDVRPGETLVVTLHGDGCTEEDVEHVSSTLREGLPESVSVLVTNDLLTLAVVSDAAVAGP